jgi:hypothetical protein
LYRVISKLLETDAIRGGDVWRNIYFYNYFQRAMREPSERPAHSDFDRGIAPFDGVLRAVRPDAVLVLSARLWKGMKNECRKAGSCQLGSVYDFTASADLRIPAAHTHHPSAPRPFDVAAWRSRVADFLKYVRAQLPPASARTMT